MNSITKQTMQLIDEMEVQLQTFHGFRHLWAELVANHEKCGLSQETLMAKQKDALSSALSQGYTLSKQLGIEWVGCCGERDALREIESLIRARGNKADELLLEKIEKSLAWPKEKF